MPEESNNSDNSDNSDDTKEMGWWEWLFGADECPINKYRKEEGGECIEVCPYGKVRKKGIVIDTCVQDCPVNQYRKTDGSPCIPIPIPTQDCPVNQYRKTDDSDCIPIPKAGLGEECSTDDDCSAAIPADIKCLSTTEEHDAAEQKLCLYDNDTQVGCNIAAEGTRFACPGWTTDDGVMTNTSACTSPQKDMCEGTPTGGANQFCKYTPKTDTAEETCTAQDGGSNPQCTVALTNAKELACKTPNSPINDARCSRKWRTGLSGCDATDFAAGGTCCTPTTETLTTETVATIAPPKTDTSATCSTAQSDACEGAQDNRTPSQICEYTPPTDTAEATCKRSDGVVDNLCTVALTNAKELVCTDPNVPLNNAKCSGSTCNATDFAADGKCCTVTTTGFANLNGIMKRYHKKTFIEKLFVLFLLYTVFYLLYKLTKRLKTLK
jgi:hypothetical protein